MPSILLVEDSREQRRIISSMLKTDNIEEIVEANHGLEALEFLNQRSFDLVICDLMMPEMDGMELIREIHLNFSGMKIIAMSGGGTAALNYYIEIMEKKLAKTISKPFTKEQINSLINSLI